MAVHSTPVRSESPALTHSVAARIVEDILAQLGSGTQVSKSELIQGVEKHIAALPLNRKTEARDLLNSGDDDFGDE